MLKPDQCHNQVTAAFDLDKGEGTALVVVTRSRRWAVCKMKELRLGIEYPHQANRAILSNCPTTLPPLSSQPQPSCLLRLCPLLD